MMPMPSVIFANTAHQSSPALAILFQTSKLRNMGRMQRTFQFFFWFLRQGYPFMSGEGSTRVDKFIARRTQIRATNCAVDLCQSALIFIAPNELKQIMKLGLIN